MAPCYFKFYSILEIQVKYFSVENQAENLHQLGNIFYLTLQYQIAIL